MANPRRQVPLLSVLFALSGTGAVLVVTAGAVTALQITGLSALSTLPVALTQLGAMAATIPFSHLMVRKGRRAGFAAATAIGSLGALLAVAAIRGGSFRLFCVASALIGVMNGVGQLYRFAAVEVSPPQRQARAIGTVLAGGVVAGLLGPVIAKRAAGFWPDSLFAGSYLALVLLQLTLLLLLPFLDVPRPPPAAKGTGRPLAAIAKDPRFGAALLAGLAAYGAMVLTMTAAPLSLRAQGASFGAIAYVIQAHVVAMYLPSFFTGRMVGRIGPRRGIAIGVALLGICCGVNLAGMSVAFHYVGLVFLGLGWNVLFVSATALLTTVYGPGEKATVQGFNDMVLAGASATAAFSAGPVHAMHGWGGLNIDVLAGLGLASLALVVLLRSRPAPAAAPTASR